MSDERKREVTEGEKQDQETQNAMETLFNFAAEKMVAGQSNGQVIRDLIEIGVERKMAEDIVYQLDKVRRDANRKEGYKSMALGALIGIIGLVITIATMAGGGGGVIAYGAIIVGAIQFFRGVYQVATA